jgi:3',5'-cyclic AMP phosphodiesterase CpdA
LRARHRSDVCAGDTSPISEFRITQISDTHLGRRFPGLIANFHRVSEHIDADRPDLVINTGDVSFDGPISRTFSSCPTIRARRLRSPPRPRAGQVDIDIEELFAQMGRER